MSIGYPTNLCSLCKHKRTGLTCDAYPVRIPRAIRTMQVDHREGYEGDGGITFEAKDDSPRTVRLLGLIRAKKDH
jgi:hypothetical protein